MKVTLHELATAILMMLLPGGVAPGTSVSPDLPGTVELGALFTAAQADSDLTQIRQALRNFTDLTETVVSNSNLGRDYGIRTIREGGVPGEARITVHLTGKELNSCGRLDWERQNIGFPNLVKYLTGHLQYLEYEKLKLQLELLRLKGAPAEEVQSLGHSVAQAESSLVREYLDPDKWTD